MPASSFGARLRAMRRAARLSQADLARAALIDAAYLSKVETAAMEPPAEMTVCRLADALRGGHDELLLLAGKVPRDVRALICAHPESLVLLRERYGRPTNGAADGR